MIDIRLTHGDGSPFNPERFRRELREGITKAAVERAKKALRGLHCPVHGQAPTVKFSTPNYLRIGGCCQDLIDAANARLGR